MNGRKRGNNIKLPGPNGGRPEAFHPLHSLAPAVLNIADARLNRLMLLEPERCASLGEYAQATGMDTTEVLDLLGPWLDNSTLSLEVWADEIFIHTAPHGRSNVSHVDVRPNLWELLRERASVEVAYSLWKLTRNLERSGWRVEKSLPRIMFGLSPISQPPFLGVEVGNLVVPLLVHPDPSSLGGSLGLLSTYHLAGASAVGIVCDNGGLDDTITVARTWALQAPLAPSLSVLVLEAPRYNPTLLSPADASVPGFAITRHTPTSLTW